MRKFGVGCKECKKSNNLGAGQKKTEEPAGSTESIGEKRTDPKVVVANQVKISSVGRDEL